MSPADGATIHILATGAAVDPLQVAVAVVLPGGRCLLALEGRIEGPTARDGSVPCAWAASLWPSALAHGSWAGLMLLDRVPSGPLEVDGPGGPISLSAPERLDVAPEAIAAFARRHGLAGRGALDFLVSSLPLAGAGAGGGGDGTRPVGRWRSDFIGGFLAAAAEPDGFVEILGLPECGGLFAQGWSVSLLPGPAAIAHLDAALDLLAVEVAAFPRDDILPPAQGVCLFGHNHAAESLAAASAVFVEQGGRLLRLDVVGGSAAALPGREATAHVAHLLPRLEGPESTLRSFRRVCRPRYEGQDTLSGTPLPIAMALDAVFEAPDGGLLAMGWLLDPLHRVERVHIRSTAGLRAPLQDVWHRLPRRDVAQGFAGDPRFARLLDHEDALYGVLAYAMGQHERVVGAETYLELVLDDGSCLFRPLAITQLQDRDRVAAIVATVPPDDPDIGAIARETLAPFLAALPPAPRHSARAPRAIPLGPPGPAREVTAVMPIRNLSELQPVLSLLAGTPDADGLDLVLVAPRSAASGLAEKLHAAFRFYGLKGALVLTSDRDGQRGRVEAGIAAAQGRRILVWTPQTLPCAPGWLARLLAAADTHGRLALLSPTLVYEDGSIHYTGHAGPVTRLGGDEAETPDLRASALLGYPAGWLQAQGAVPVPCGAAELMLVDAAALRGAGGFSGRLFGDGLAHRDLAHRLHAAGTDTLWMGDVEFWMLDDGKAIVRGPFETIMDKVDALLVARPKEGSRP